MQRPCPICGCTASRPLGETRFARIQDVTPHGGYTVVACDRCGFAFASGIPAQAVFSDYYRDNSKYDVVDATGDVDETTHRRHQAEAAEILQAVGSTSASVLDVGCATGALLRTLRDQGVDRVFGLEPSPSCAEIAARVHGLAVTTGGLFDPAALEIGQFDAVISTAVLEHVVDIDSFMRRLMCLVRPGGMLYLETPDAWNFAGLDDAPFQQLSIEHINYFSRDSLENLGRMHGCEPILSWEVSRTHLSGGGDPCVAVALRRTDRMQPLVPDRRTTPALAEYLKISRERELPLLERARDFSMQGPIVVWGCGAFCLRMLVVSDLGRASIAAFVDRNPRYQGRTVMGTAILAPTELTEHEAPIVVATHGHARGVRAAITRLGLTNQVLDFAI